MNQIENVWITAIGKEWVELLSPELLDINKSSTLLAFLTTLALDKSSPPTYAPDYSNIFRVFKLIKPKDIKVICMGQDPYHSINNNRLIADGLAFSCSSGRIPPSLANIFKEVYRDGFINYPRSGNLESWVKQGVFLLNRVLTVKLGKPNSHANEGWEWFTSLVINKLSSQYTNLVFLLWGEKALKVKKDIQNIDNQLILKAGHPSPYSYDNGFKHCGHFKLTNEYLLSINKTPIEWG